MFDLNQILSAALNAAVAEAIKPLVERIATQEALLQNATRIIHERLAALENNPAIGVDTTLEQRVVALETKLTEAKLFEQTTHVQTLMSPEMIVDSMNNAEWLWEKINAYIETGIDDRMERAIDDHCSTYDHDEYDSVVSNWNDEDPADFLREGDLHDQIDDRVNETLRNATFSISI
jgi:hypothetical protein